jgi:cell division protein ZapA (FtsZ GTPase activity inhibitor)
MKEEISIKVNIADVVYPLRVAVEDEQNIRKAAKLINEKIRTYRDDYQLADKANLLSMVALQFAVEVIQFNEKKWIEDINISTDIAEIAQILGEASR